MIQKISKSDAARLAKEGVSFKPKKPKAPAPKAATQVPPAQAAAAPGLLSNAPVQDTKRLDEAVALFGAAAAEARAAQAQITMLRDELKAIRIEMASLHPAQYIAERDRQGVLMSLKPVPVKNTIN